MTRNADRTTLTDRAADPAPGRAERPARLSTGRLTGVDLARGLAVFGMYAAHVGPDPAQGGFTGHVMELAHGRASALFAFLAGFSVMLITGRRTPKTGRAGRQAVAKVVIAVGSMSLTAYVFHIAGIHVLGIEELPGSPLHVLLGFAVAVTVFAAVWARYFRRGPLEWLLGKAAKPAELVR